MPRKRKTAAPHRTDLSGTHTTEIASRSGRLVAYTVVRWTPTGPYARTKITEVQR